MVLTCMEEAKRLGDTAYKEQRERWVTGHFPALGKAAPGLSEKELDAGTSWVWMGPSVCLSVFVSLGLRTSLPMALPLSGHPGP